MLDNIHPSIRGALLFFCLIFVSSITSVVFSNIYLNNLSDAERSSKRDTQTWKRKIEQAKENNRIIVEYEKPYLELVKNGVVGEENRLSWFESLQATASSRGLDTFRYSTASQVKVNPKELSGDYKNLDIYKSIMTLEMEMSHEGDMFAVFNDLEENAKGLYSINNCHIAKNKTKPNSSNDNGLTIKASCELSWHSIKPAKT